MPTYQYACTACGERCEAVQSFTDAPLTDCPACAGALRKVFSAVGVVFKGSGFYKTDSRPPAKTGSEGKGSGGDASSSTSTGDAGSKSDSGSATKSESKADKGGGKGESAPAKPAAAPASTPASKTA